MSSPDSVDDPELAAARRVVGLLAVAVVAAVVGIGLVLVGAREDDPSTVGPSAADVIDTSDPSSVSLGPPAGVDVPGYVDERTDALRRAEGRHVAVISLTGYSSVETVEDLLEGLELDSYLIALVGDEARRSDDVDDVRDRVVADAEAQLPELEGIAPTVDDPEFIRFYEEEIARYRTLLEAADRDDVVFGLVVAGPASRLRALAERASVRLVDVGDSGELAADAVVTGLRPEEVAVTGQPPFRP